MAQPGQEDGSGAMSSLPPGPLVQADWLRAHIGDVLVLDASIDRRPDGYFPGDALFATGHIPGAQFADLVAAFSDPAAPFPFTAPSAAGLEQAVRRLGISGDSAIVVYDSLSGAWAARLWWVLRAFGHDRVRVLDGGLAAWKAAGGAVAQGLAGVRAEGNFVARTRPGFFVGTAEIETAIGAVPMLCATRVEEFAAGHIPASRSLPYASLLGADNRLDLAAAAQARATLGLASGAPVILYCGGGINAAGLALAFAALGEHRVQIYDGSLSEWRADPARPLERAGAT